MTQIIPALIASDKDQTNDFEELKKKFKKFQPFLVELGNWVQIDITDGKFVSAKTNIDPEDLKYFTGKTNVEFHLMIDKPEEIIGGWASLGPKRIIVHIEAIEYMDELLNVCREKNVELGLALNPETPNAMIEPWINDVDLILFLGVRPGRGGQKFIPGVLKKIKSLRQNFPNVKIEADGGIRAGNIAALKAAGVDIFVIGSGILEASDVKGAIDKLKERIYV